MAMLVIGPVLLLTGGLLAPLSCSGTSATSCPTRASWPSASLGAARYVANELAGAAGSVWMGIAVAVLLHAFNILLGAFAPTIHALRLHYVEFFGKFIETGGRRYEPLKKVD